MSVCLLVQVDREIKSLSAVSGNKIKKSKTEVSQLFNLGMIILDVET